MVEVCEQTKSKNDMLDQSIEQYKEVYIKARREFDKVINVCVSKACSVHHANELRRVWGGILEAKLVHLAGAALVDLDEEMAAMAAMAEVTAEMAEAITDDVEAVGHPTILPIMAILVQEEGARRQAGQISMQVKYRFLA